MNNKLLQQKINQRKSLIANLPFEYDPKDTTIGNASMTVEQGMARASRLALKGVASSSLNLYRLRGGK
jgi:hypothetical protein|tara:strand:- start:1770 stop:1973 length:204 start_codon:yes stop_codon:yes gene_type:complete